MSTSSLSLQSIGQSLLTRLPPSISTLLQGNAAARLLKKADAILLVFEDKLYNLSNGQWRSIQTSAEQHLHAVIAQAAHELLSEREESPSILLLLPPQTFIATQVNMPGISKDSLRSALQLQSSVLLPSYESPLLFAVNPHTELNANPDVVIWSDENLLDSLYTEFAEQDLFLLGVMPRNIAAAQWHKKDGKLLLVEEDSDSITLLVYQDAVLSEFQQVKRSDLSDADFLRQWQETLADLTTVVDEQLNITSAEPYCAMKASELAHTEYSFIPQGARDVLQQKEKGKRIVYGVVAAVVVTLLASSPFLLQSVQLMRLQSQLNNLQMNSTQAREDQAAVRDFETSWGVLNEFPRQHIPDVLLQLQAVLTPNVLTSMEITEGSIEIEGESADPQSLLQLLEQDAMFTGVDFARATNNNRYYIEMRLSTVDYDAYRQRYFPDVRR